MRNLSFIALCSLGLAALAASLAPLPRPAARRELRQVEVPADLADLVGRLNATFQQSWSAAGLTPMPGPTTWRSPAGCRWLWSARFRRWRKSGSSKPSPPSSARRGSSKDCWRTAARTIIWPSGWPALVGVQDGPFIIYRRRRFVSWLADELSANRPYDQIARQILSTDGLWTDHPATNFITVTIKPDQDKDPDAKELAGRTARALLGIRMDCAECHDHPFDSWKQTDFQHLAAFFGQTRQSFAGIQDDPGRTFQLENRTSGEMETITPQVPFQGELLPADGTLRKSAWPFGSRIRRTRRLPGPRSIASGLFCSAVRWSNRSTG